MQEKNKSKVIVVIERNMFFEHFLSSILIVLCFITLVCEVNAWEVYGAAGIAVVSHTVALLRPSVLQFSSEQ